MGKIRTSESGGSDARSIALWLAAACLIAIAIYGSSLGGDFCLDDDLIIIDSQVAHGLAHLPQAFTTHFLPGFQGAESLYYRPLITASFQLDYSLGGLDPHIFRFTNLLLYLLCTGLVFLLARKITGSIPIAGLTAIAFVILPSHAESVSWISGRTDMLAAIFMLASLLLFIKSTEQGFSWKLAVPVGLLFMAGLFSKEIAAITPLLFLVYIWSQDKRISRGEVVKWLAVLIPAFLIYAGLRLWVLGNTFDQPHSSILSERLIKIGLAYAIYLRMLFIPTEPQVYYNSYSIEPFSNLPLIISAWLAPLALISLAIWGRKRVPVLAFGAAWMLTSLLLCTEIVPANGLLKPFDHFVFVASVGSSIIVGWLFWRLYEMRPKQIRTWPAVVTAVGVAYVAASAAMASLGTSAFQSNIDWARTVARQKPDYWIFRSSAAMFLSGAGEIEKAVGEYEATIDCGNMPPKDEAHYAFMLGRIYAERVGDVEGALRNLQRAVKADPESGEAWKMLGLIRTLKGDFKEAITAYQESSKLTGLNSKDHLMLGRAYKGLEQKEKAAEEFRAALAADPSGRAGQDAAAELESLSSTP